MKQLRPNYRITQEDFQRGWKLFEKEFSSGQDLKEQELHFQELLLDAERMYRQTGQYPTVQDVLDHRTKEKYEAERKRIASWQNEGRISAYDFSCYEQQLADGEDGPFVNFMRVAASLKQSGRHNLTVGDVRAEIKKAA
jgi:hypothetical protein